MQVWSSAPCCTKRVVLLSYKCRAYLEVDQDGKTGPPELPVGEQPVLPPILPAHNHILHLLLAGTKDHRQRRVLEAESYISGLRGHWLWTANMTGQACSVICGATTKNMQMWDVVHDLRHIMMSGVSRRGSHMVIHQAVMVMVNPPRIPCCIDSRQALQDCLATM